MPSIETLLVMSRWSQALAALYLQMNAGLQDAFSDYAFQFRESLDYTELQVTGLGTAKDAGIAIFGFLFGMSFDLFPAWWAILASVTADIAGFLLIWALYTHQLSAPYPVVWCIFVLAYGCNAGYALGPLKYTLGNFPEFRGMAAGFLKPMDGLCAAIYTQIHLALVPSISGFLLLQAVLPATVAVLTLPFMSIFKNTKDTVEEKFATERTFLVAAGFSLFLALYILGMSVAEALLPDLSRAALRGMFAALLVLVSAYALLLPLHGWLLGEAEEEAREGQPASPLLGSGSDRLESQELGLKADSGGTGYGTIGPTTTAGGGGPAGDAALGAGGGAFAGPEQGRHDTKKGVLIGEEGQRPGCTPCTPIGPCGPCAEDENTEVFGARKYYDGECSTMQQAMGTRDFWITFAVFFLNSCVGFSVYNNLSQLCNSLGEGGAAAILTALASCANCLGRIIGGQLSERALFNGSRLARSVWLVANCACQFIGCLLIALARDVRLLFLAVPLVTAAFGSQNTLIVSIIHERFGHKHFASIVGLTGLSLLPASLLVSTVLASVLYDAEARRQGAEGPNVYCLGPACFRLFFQLLSLFAVLGGGFSVWHFFHFRAFYDRMVMRRSSANLIGAPDVTGGLKVA